MTPLSGRTQTVESWKLSCPGAVGTAWQDQYGNLCHTLTVAEPVSELEIKVYGLVRTRDTNGVVGMTPSELPSSIYLRETPHTVVSRPIQDFAARFREQRKNDLIETLHEVMLAIADAVEYRKGETHVHTIGSEALEQGAGVCQDHAHIFCAVCRALDGPRVTLAAISATARGTRRTPQATPGPRPSWIISDGSASILLTARVPPMPIFAPRSGSITLRQAQYEG